MKRVIVAMSGGVDSSVAAALLQRQGYEVQGMFMKNWSLESSQSLSDCPWMQDQADAEAVCDHLGIPFRSINFEREYRQQVLEYFLREYRAGRTPNPDIMCNKEIKFGHFLQAAKGLGAEHIATGHYARKSGDGRLRRGVDPNKDQSYFLYALDREQLDRTLFPLGDMAKPQVRALARELGLPTARKRDSQGICFIGHLDVKQFLRENLHVIPGSVYLLPPDTGSGLESRKARAGLIGEDQPTAYYTVGERAGAIVDNRRYAAVAGSTDVPPLFILCKDPDGTAYVTSDPHDPDMYARYLWLEGWSGSEPDIAAGLYVQSRYQQQEAVPLQAFSNDNGMIRMTVDAPCLRAVAPGQAAVVYAGDGTVIGGGTVFQASAPR